MNDLSNYCSQAQEIKDLKKKVRLLEANNSKWKRKYEEATGNRYNVQKRNKSRAHEYVVAWINGDKSLTFVQIAEKCFLDISTIKNLSYRLRHSNNDCSQ
mgnify:CR=1 FL=1